jgi:hypothetical protein
VKLPQRNAPRLAQRLVAGRSRRDLPANYSLRLTLNNVSAEDGIGERRSLPFPSTLRYGGGRSPHANFSPAQFPANREKILGICISRRNHSAITPQLQSVLARKIRSSRPIGTGNITTVERTAQSSKTTSRFRCSAPAHYVLQCWVVCCRNYPKT